VQAERSTAGYLKIARISKKIRDDELGFYEKSKLGDDNADAFAMSNFFLDTIEALRRIGAVGVDYIHGL